MSEEELTEKVLSLPLPERIHLAQALWQSIDDEPDPGSDEERNALEMAKKRDQELSSGSVEGRSHQQVMEAARRALR